MKSILFAVAILLGSFSITWAQFNCSYDTSYYGTFGRTDRIPCIVSSSTNYNGVFMLGIPDSISVFPADMMMTIDSIVNGPCNVTFCEGNSHGYADGKYVFCISYTNESSSLIPGLYDLDIYVSSFQQGSPGFVSIELNDLLVSWGEDTVSTLLRVSSSYAQCNNVNTIATTVCSSGSLSSNVCAIVDVFPTPPNSIATPEISTITALEAYYNSSQGLLELSYENTLLKTGLIQIVNLSGSVIHAEGIQLNPGTGYSIIDMPDVSQGLYLMVLTIPEGSITRKFMVAGH